MARNLKTRTMAVKADEGGVYLRLGNTVFRPDPGLLKDTQDSRTVLAELALMGLPDGSEVLDYLPLVEGQKVLVSVDPSTRKDTIGVMTLADPDGPGTRRLWPGGTPPGVGNYLTWSDEQAPLRPDVERSPAPGGMSRR